MGADREAIRKMVLSIEHGSFSGGALELAHVIRALLTDLDAAERHIRQLEEKISRQRVDLRKEKELRDVAEKGWQASRDLNATLRDRVAELEAGLREGSKLADHLWLSTHAHRERTRALLSAQKEGE